MFDVDKVFLMLPEFSVQTYDMVKAKYDFKRGQKSEQSILKDLDALFANDNTGVFNGEVESAPKEFKEWFKSRKEEYRLDKPRFHKIRYNEDAGPEGNSRQARNNQIIDIGFSVLTHPDITKNLLHPGNYDNVKRMSRISILKKDSNMLRLFMEENNLTIDTIADFLLDRNACSTEYLDKFTSSKAKERNPLSLSNFIHFHTQNMAGGALIGVYANSTTAQAKFQGTKLAIRKNRQFIINGRQIGSLSKITSELGELISQNCAEFSAASVDNGKDPVLADLNQNLDTAKAMNVLIRAGLSIEEAGLIFTNPLVDWYVKSTGDLNGFADIYRDPRYPSIISRIRSLLNTLGQGSVTIYNKKKPKLVEFTSKELLEMSIKDPGIENAEELVKRYIENPQGVSVTTIDNLIKHYTRMLDFAYMMSNIVDTANDLNEVTSVSRADSPNGAISSNLAGALNQVHRVNHLHRRAFTDEFTLIGIDDVVSTRKVNPNMSVSEMREVLRSSNMPMIQAFFSLGIDLAVQNMAPYFISCSDYAGALIEFLNMNSPIGTIGEKNLLKFIRALTYFGLTKSQLFGNEYNEDGSIKRSYDEKRQYYLYEYPGIFEKIKANNPNLRGLNIIRKLRVVNGEIRFNSSGKIDPSLRDLLTRELDSLLYSEDPELLQLAEDLYMYSFYHDGLQFGPKSYGRFFSADFQTKIPGYINTLREMQFYMHSGSHFDRFLKQFYASEYQSMGMVPKRRLTVGFRGPNIVNIGNGSISVDHYTAMNRNFGTKTSEAYKLLYIDSSENGIEKGLYVLDSDRSTRENKVYVKIPEIRDSFGYPRYNANSTVEELGNFIPNEELIKNNRKIGAYEDPFAGLEGIDFEGDFADTLAAMEMEDMSFLDNIELYDDAAAENELDEPLC